MSITLPPFPAGVAATDRMREYATAYATAAVEAYIASGVPMTDAQVAAYGTASVEADRASRVPMTLRQRTTLITEWSNNLETLHELIKHVEAHHGIGAKP